MLLQIDNPNDLTLLKSKINPKLLLTDDSENNRLTISKFENYPCF